MVDRAPLIVAVGSNGKSPVLVTRVRQQIERLLPPAISKLAEFAGANRATVKQHIATLPERRRFWQRILGGSVAAHVLQGKDAAADELFQAELTNAQPITGYAWIVGAGPGDPELLTLKAARVLADADVILHDRLVAPAILDMARRDATFISVGKQAGQPSIKQAEINQLLVDHVRSGARVCRLKGGDPFIFGRGGEEIAALQAADLPWEVIPGITAASGCAAATGVPLTHRETAHSVTLLTASTADGSDTDWSQYAAQDQTLVIYMAVSKLAQICTGLIAAGRPAEHPAMLVENATTDRQRLLRGTLSNLADKSLQANIKTPALLIVGDVVDLNDTLREQLETLQPRDGWSSTANG
jgi:uroporphyrin-III C-methyltransferase/precorrin-2 dehydrogenase/sirohydrochlorin ferrochelatase